MSNLNVTLIAKILSPRYFLKAWSWKTLKFMNIALAASVVF